MQNGMVKNNISYKIVKGFLEENIFQETANLYSEIFKDADLDFFKHRIEQQPKLFSILAFNNKKMIGFKIGYPYDENIFYSWIGGVLPKHQRKGIAKHMAKLQEEYAVLEGFIKLRTKSMNSYKAMMILNLKNGFDITKIYTNSKGQTKVVFEKQLH